MLEQLVIINAILNVLIILVLSVIYLMLKEQGDLKEYIKTLLDSDLTDSDVCEHLYDSVWENHNVNK